MFILPSNYLYYHDDRHSGPSVCQRRISILCRLSHTSHLTTSTGQPDLPPLMEYARRYGISQDRYLASKGKSGLIPTESPDPGIPLTLRDKKRQRIKSDTREIDCCRDLQVGSCKTLACWRRIQKIVLQTLMTLHKFGEDSAEDPRNTFLYLLQYI
jgi:hypothetical protein